MIQLGDLGHGKHGSGGTKCFEFAKEFIGGFGSPAALVLGNHGARLLAHYHKQTVITP